jgi:hypothetical protein
VQYAARRLSGTLGSYADLPVNDGGWSSGDLEVSAPDISAMSRLHSSELSGLMVDAVRKQASHMDCGIGSYPCDFPWISGRKPCKSVVFNIFVKKFLKRLSQHVERWKTGQSTCCDFYVNHLLNGG